MRECLKGAFIPVGHQHVVLPLSSKSLPNGDSAYARQSSNKFDSALA